MSRDSPDEKEDVETETKAVVIAVVSEPKRGQSYIVTVTPEEFKEYLRTGRKAKSTVTCNLADWQGEGEPKWGLHVLLGGVEKMPNGWCASRARKLRLSDEKPEAQPETQQAKPGLLGSLVSKLLGIKWR